MTKTDPAIGFGWSMGAPCPSLERLHRKVLSGLPYGVIGTFGRTAGIERVAVLRHIALSPSTSARRKSDGRLKPDESGRVARLALLFERATELFEGDRPAALRWLRSPAPALSGATPLEMAGTEVGARAVEELIGRLEHGVFT